MINCESFQQVAAHPTPHLPGCNRTPNLSPKRRLLVAAAGMLAHAHGRSLRLGPERGGRGATTLTESRESEATGDGPPPTVCHGVGVASVNTGFAGPAGMTELTMPAQDRPGRRCGSDAPGPGPVGKVGSGPDYRTQLR
jgi:hypothetical protein